MDLDLCSEYGVETWLRDIKYNPLTAPPGFKNGDFD